MAEQNNPGVEQATGAAVASVDFFVQFSPVFSQIADDAEKAKVSSSKIAELFARFLGFDTGQLEPIKAKDAEPLKMESIAATEERAFDLAKLALILPLLLDPTARNYLANFIQGLVGAETLDKITFALKAVGAVLAGVFAVKLFKQISDTISTFVRLSQVVGTLFGLTQENNDLEIEDATKKERDKWEKRKEKFEKNKSANRAKRLKKLEKARKFRKVLKALGKVGKFTGIGFIVGAAAEAFVDSIFDYFSKEQADTTDAKFPDTEDEEVDKATEDEGDDFMSIGAMILKKFISNLTFGVVSEETLDKAFKYIGKFFGVENKSNTTSAATVESKPTPTATPSTPAPSTGSSGSQAAPATQPTPAPSTTGQTMATTSEQVAGAKKDLSTGSTVVNNVDNSVVVVNNQSQPKDYGSTAYSVSVGT